LTNLHLTKARILVVEDEMIVALDIKQRLESMGYAVVATVVTGEQALQKAEDLSPDLVLMDIKLKGKMDGIQAAEVIRSSYHTPVIFLTAFADEATLQRARITEAFGYILKPFEERELSVNIEMALYKHKMEFRLFESEERYRLAVQGANDGLWDWNLRTGEVFYSPRWINMLGFSDHEIGSSPEDWFQLIHLDDLDRFKLDLSNHLAGRTIQFQIEYRILSKADGYRWVLTRGVAIFDTDGVPYRIAGSLSDVTERKQAELRLLHDAFHDTLTGLPNRALFVDRLQRVMERARRSEKDNFGVLFLDLDRFKVVNDSLGHQIGDRLLMALSGRLKKLLRSCDTLARLGGDEFVILLEELESANDSTVVSERIQDDLKQPFQLAGQAVFVSVSIGIVCGTTEYEHPEDMLRDADIAMYRAKASGRARYAVFDTALRERAMTRLELEGDLRVALGRDEIKIYYQPILSLTSGKVLGFEALLRWFHPRRGLISPGEFIPLAEETGLILPIGRWVLREACRQLVAWQTMFRNDPPLTMSVNISGRQFAQNTLLEQIRQVLKETGLDPHTLKLEITESLLMESSPTALTTLRDLREMGIQLLIDDFGTGYSSLGYVQNFPIDTLKIDRMFISQMTADRNHSEIARTIIQLAHELGLGTIAEGIETVDQLRRLNDLNCEYGQGWLFSKAQSPEQMEALLQKGFYYTLSEGGTLQNLPEGQNSDRE
jgi:diguanylate cyclase (GGDEF)-like protein/PAS domain S-box-containing protein